MALNTWQFLLLAACAAFFLPLTRGWIRTALFLALNLVFVWSYWGAAATPVAMAFCLAGYACARLVPRRSTGVFAASLVVLTGLFAYLRGYSTEFLTTGGGPTVVGVMAFAGLSFMFFKIVHVVIDAAAGTVGPLPFWSYVNYCLNFTTVLMGPIQRYQDFAAQWASPGAAPQTFEALVDASNRVLRGLLKAFALAPLLAPYVLQTGLPIESLSGTQLLLRTYAFYIYLYLEFSGYCDIMIGVGSWMGIRPPENFFLPFLARNVSAYWLRVHRSLTQWLTDYVFTPTYRVALGAPGLGRHAFLALSASLILTMLVAGVWHGTTLHFAVFGAVHGVALVAVRGYEHWMVRWLGRARFRRITDTPYVTVAAVFLTYNFTSLAYTFFVLDLHESVRLFGRLTALAAARLTA